VKRKPKLPFFALVEFKCGSYDDGPLGVIPWVRGIVEVDDYGKVGFEFRDTPHGGHVLESRPKPKSWNSIDRKTRAAIAALIRERFHDEGHWR